MPSIVPGMEKVYGELLTIAIDYFIAIHKSVGHLPFIEVAGVAEMIAWKTCYDMIDDREAITDVILSKVNS